MSDESGKYEWLDQVIVNLGALRELKNVISIDIESDEVIIEGLTKEDIHVTYKVGLREAERKGLLILKKN